jgi:murein DD-endopeptidase MepM/ murein hydrolase activator NlpD
MRNVIIFFTCCFFFATSASFASAQGSRIEELQQSISSREADIKQLEEEIADYKNRINNVAGQKKTLQGAISSIDLSRAKLRKDIELTQKKIEQANATIGTLSDSITDKERRIERNKKAISDIIFRIDQSDGNTMLEILLANSSISAFLLDIDDLSKLQRSIQDSIKSLENLKSELGATKTSVQSERKKLGGFNTRLSDQKEIADTERKRQALLLSTTKNQESNYKKLLAEREVRKRQFEREVDDFEAQLRAEIDPTSFPAPGTKVFIYPLTDHYVTQKFGKTVDARRLYTSGTHNGTDFRAAPGSVVIAVASGEVVATGDTDKVCPGASYGRWVMVRHRNGLSSLYAHLELIKVRAGQEVETGDTLGYSGNTGYSTGPHLHFTVYVSSAVDVVDLPSKSCKGAVFHIPVAAANAYLDPLDYL